MKSPPTPAAPRPNSAGHTEADILYCWPSTAPASITYPASSITGRYSVAWTASAGAASYTVTRSNNGGATWVQVYSGSAVSYSENITNGSYCYSVKAVNSGGASSWTARTDSCLVCTTPPSVPASLSYPASSKTGRYTVSWPAASKATSYVLKRSRNGSSTWTEVYSGSSRSYSESVTTNGTYRYSVKAVNLAGSSGWRASSLSCVVKR